MSTKTVEPLEARIIIEGSEQITIDEETTAVLRAHALEKLEQALVEANACFNVGTDTHEQVRELLWAAQEVKQYADVVYTLTPVPLEDLDD